MSSATRRTIGSNRSTSDRRQARGELVEEQQPRLACERPGDGEHLLLAAREQTHAPVAQLPQCGKVVVGGVDVEPLAAVMETQVLGDGQAEEEARSPPGRVRCHAVRGRCGEVRATSMLGRSVTVPLIGRTSAGDDAEGRGLARAVRAQQRNHLSRTDLQREPRTTAAPPGAGREPVESSSSGALTPAPSPADRRSAMTSAAALPKVRLDRQRNRCATSSGGRGR